MCSSFWTFNTEYVETDIWIWWHWLLQVLTCMYYFNVCLTSPKCYSLMTLSYRWDGFNANHDVCRNLPYCKYRRNLISWSWLKRRWKRMLCKTTNICKDEVNSMGKQEQIKITMWRRYSKCRLKSGGIKHLTHWKRNTRRS